MELPELCELEQAMWVLFRSVLPVSGCWRWAFSPYPACHHLVNGVAPMLASTSTRGCSSSIGV